MSPLSFIPHSLPLDLFNTRTFAQPPIFQDCRLKSNAAYPGRSSWIDEPTTPSITTTKEDNTDNDGDDDDDDEDAGMCVGMLTLASSRRLTVCWPVEGRWGHSVDRSTTTEIHEFPHLTRKIKKTK